MNLGRRELLQAGVALGLHDPAAPVLRGFDAEGDGYYGTLSCAREVAAVGAECMLVLREDFIEAGTREEPPFRTRLPRAGGLVVGIEAVGEPLIERSEARQMRLQHESLEEPGGVREVPLGRAGVVHGLDDLILRAQRFGKSQGQAARFRQAPGER